MITIPKLAIRFFFPIFVLFSIISSLAVIFIILTPPLWGILIFYSIWWYRDRETPWKNGRPSQWVRSWKAWKYCADYFNSELIKTTDLPLDRNYVFAIHPHGVLGTATIFNFVTEARNITEKFKLDFRIVTLPINFRIPFHRDLELALGLISSDADSIEYTLSLDTKGKAVCIVPGGAEESLDAHPGNYDLTLKQRKGFVRLALKTGSDLVPVYNFGETSIFHQIPNARGSFIRKMQQAFKSATGIAPIICCGRGFIMRGVGIIPIQAKIATVVGAPIRVKMNSNPSKKEIDNLHDEYVSALIKLFDEHKVKYGVPEDAQLRIV
uniref:Acyltransferase n=1 Tax=Panagrolaimus sp. ES5 TaxID=591445 RepID=A0AC34FEZ2_9BILA